MKTSALLTLHERQCAIIDLIKRAKVRENNALDDLQKDFNIQIFGRNRLIKECVRWQSVQKRLIKYYLDVQERIKALQPTSEPKTESPEEIENEVNSKSLIS